MWLGTHIATTLGALAAAVSASAANDKPQNASAYNLCQLRDRLGSNGTKRFEIPTHLPNISFEIPPSWGGYEPVSNKPNETRQIYFWMVPATGDVGVNDFVIWFNGGPGCSSLSGILGEEGPVKMDPVTYVAKSNPYSWTNLTNMMWVDQPAGTSFSRGAALNQSMEQVAEDFNGSLLNLYKDFPKLRGKNLWLMGESFSGKFIPYMAHQIYKNEKENMLAGIQLKGIGMNDAFSMTT